ncbi:PREDICTED: leucine-rich repeat-containing G-protein coupled receptor 5-like [Vollenhovia emeryi]|uniref:leucine-rich repeat-containing G-protein coupled receptor 5-like n=1 Tax=Vollenhovia emeryi TaxID=411798 RepID=UPI0005F4DCFC|nr:PREDICTED: leucine-rich repeat-containing G-protein coupled receptor 5-like [Vollenhovia emeryi]
MKNTICFVLILSFYGKYTLQQVLYTKSVSIRSDDFENIYNTKITNEPNQKIKNCDSTEELNLSGMNLKFIPNDIIRSDAIRHVSLANNFLKKIPQNILFHVTSLSCLNMSRNSLNLYEENKIHHAYVRVLDLSYQTMVHINALPELEVFDEDLRKEKNYEHMIFDSSKMRLPNAEYLDLSGNDISSLNWDFNISFPKLVRLDLMNINAEELDPNFFNKIPSSLRILHLEDNYLYNLTLENLAEIASLHLDGNPIKKLNIKSATLLTLSLANCTILNEEAVLDTPNLEQLDLSRNNMYNSIDIFYVNPLNALRILLLDNNELSHIPILSNVQWLTELSLSYNMIEYIKPHSFQYLQFLNKLSLKKNRINRIDKVTFSGLNRLEYLDLSENQLSYLPTDWTLPLTNLQYLNLNSNLFGSIGDMGIYSVPSLQHLFVKNNTFTKITTLELDPFPDFITVYLY